MQFCLIAEKYKCRASEREIPFGWLCDGWADCIAQEHEEIMLCYTSSSSKNKIVDK